MGKRGKKTVRHGQCKFVIVRAGAQCPFPAGEGGEFCDAHAVYLDGVDLYNRAMQAAIPFASNLKKILGNFTDPVITEDAPRPHARQQKQGAMRKAPLPIKKHLRTLGLDEIPTIEELKDLRRELAKKHHPDKGGDVSKMSAINSAADWLESFINDRNRSQGVA